MRQPNGCSTPSPKSSAAKQWIKELAQKKEGPPREILQGGAIVVYAPLKVLQKMYPFTVFFLENCTCERLKSFAFIINRLVGICVMLTTL